MRGTVLEHAFTVVNQGAAPLRFDRIRLTPPLRPSLLPREIAAHGEAVVRVKLDTRTLAGEYEGVVLVSFKDAAGSDVRLTFTGRVFVPLEVVPPVLTATAQRGEKKEAAVEIINHETEPVRIEPAAVSSTRFTTRLETIEEGRRFRLTLALNPDGPAGRNQETITLKTSSSAVPELKIAAYTVLTERVYTFPDAVDLGTFRMEDVRRAPQLLKNAAQTLMVYRKGTSDFQANVSTSLQELSLISERGPLGDRYQITVSLVADKIRPGTIKGSIVIETNDPGFPSLTVPVSGEILGEAEDRQDPARS